MKRILHITTFLQGGAGRVVADLACWQRLAGWDVAVASAARETDEHAHYPAWAEQLTEHGVPLVGVDCTFRRSPALQQSAVATLDHLAFVREGLDVVHAHAAVPALIGLALAGHAPVLATMHGWNARKSAAHAAADVAAFNRLPVVAVPSRAAAAHLSQAGVESRRLALVPYGVVPQPMIGLTSDEQGLVDRWRADKRLVAVCVGSVGPRKRQAELLEAIARPDIRDRMACAFLGEGPALDEHVALARARGIDGAVAFLGYRANVTDWYAATDVAVFPSSREGLPIALLEAAALGACVIVSPIDEHLEVVAPDVSGLVLGSDDPQALADTLARATVMSAASRAAMGSALRDIWRQHYTPEGMHAEYARLYDLMQSGASTTAG